LDIHINFKIYKKRSSNNHWYNWNHIVLSKKCCFRHQKRSNSFD